jgi:hypothetical protein
MQSTMRLLKCSFVIALIGTVWACGREPDEGYFDRDHHRYYHEHAWRDCAEHDDHCRDRA